MDFEALKKHLKEKPMEELLLRCGDYVVYIQECDDGYDYTIFDAEVKDDIDGGRIDLETDETMPIWEVLLCINDGMLTLSEDMELLSLDQVDEYMI